MSRADVVEALSGFPVRLAQAAYDAEAAGHRPPPGEWGAPEVVRHLIAVEAQVFQARLAAVRAEDDPHWAWTEPGLAPGFDDATLDTILAAFAGARGVTVATIRALDEDGWARFGTHTTYGILDVEGLLRIAIDHDADHLRGLDAR